MRRILVLILVLLVYLFASLIPWQSSAEIISTITFNPVRNLIETEDGTFKVNNDTKIFDLTGWDGEKFSDADIGIWDQLEDRKNVRLQAIVDKDNNVKYIFVFYADGKDISKTHYALVDSITGDHSNAVLVLPNNSKKEYKNKTLKNLNAYDFIYYQLNNKNEIVDIEVLFHWENYAVPKNINLLNAKLDRNPVKLRVTNATNTTIKGFDGNVPKVYHVDNKTVYYDVASQQVISGVQKGDYIVMYETDDDQLKHFDYVLLIRNQDWVHSQGVQVDDKGNWIEFFK